MKITTKCERVQPTCVGINEQGELVWEGKAMAYWQMAMFPVRYIGDFLTHWSMTRLTAHTGIEHDEPIASMDLTTNRYGYLKKKRQTWGA